MPLSEEFLNIVPFRSTKPQGKIIILNGPPSSGKGEAQQYLVNTHPSLFPFSFKSRLINITCAIYNIPRQKWDGWYTREGKELPRKELNGLSQRQALIEVSESVIKPFYGLNYFGECAAKEVGVAFNEGVVAAVSDDGGFDSELASMVDVFGKDNVYVIRLHREGYTFAKDSRTYVQHPELEDDHYIDITNCEGRMDEFLNDIDIVYNKIMNT